MGWFASLEPLKLTPDFISYTSIAYNAAAIFDSINRAMYDSLVVKHIDNREIGFFMDS